MGYHELQHEGIDIVSNRLLGREIIKIYEAKYDYLNKVENEIDLNFRISVLLPILIMSKTHEFNGRSCNFRKNMSLDTKNKLIEGLIYDTKHKNTQLKIYSEITLRIKHICSIILLKYN